MTNNNTTHYTQDLTDIEHRNKIDDYKLELMDLIDSGMFYSARKLLTKCIIEVSDYRTELCK
jgi:hypothetical protein